MNGTVVINATCIGKYIDGIGVRALNLLRELAQSESRRQFIIYLNHSASVHFNDIRFPDHWDVHWVSSIISPDHGFKGHLLRLLFSHLLGIRHWHPTMLILGQLEAICFRRNQIVTVHDVIPLLFKRLHKKQYLYFKHVLKFVLHRARCVVTPSQHTKELIVEKYGLSHEKIRVIPCGVQDALLHNPQQRTEDGKFILFSGRFVPMKNIAGVLAAFHLIKDRIPHKMVITGHCRSEEIEKSLLSECSIDRERVIFNGHVSAAEMENLLNHASLVVFPSFYEGFGLPPLEGMAHGCPVVVSNVASLPEVCGEAAEYVDPCSIRSIADGMWKVLTDDSLRKERVRQGLERVKLFRWDQITQQHITLFDEALSQRHPHVQLRQVKWRFAEALQAHSSFGVLLLSVFKFHLK